MVTWRKGGRAILAHARRAAKEVEASGGTDTARVRLARDLLRGRVGDDQFGRLALALAALTVDERHYKVGVFYTLLLSADVWRDQAAYFTPPYLANAVLSLAVEYGFDLRSGSVLDPAAGGAAFLSTIAARMSIEGAKPSKIARRLRGVEIDPGLARISRALIAERLMLGGVFSIDVRVADALRRRWKAEFDLVVANPPYGRITPAALTGDHWKKVAHSGNINKYAVFAELCLRAAKPGALIALVIPSSFRTGPLYTKLLGYLRDQAQVLCVAAMRRAGQWKRMKFDARERAKSLTTRPDRAGGIGSGTCDVARNAAASEAFNAADSHAAASSFSCVIRLARLILSVANSAIPNAMATKAAPM